MTRIEIIQTINCGEVEVPDAAIDNDEVFTYLDENNAWPNKAIVMSSDYNILLPTSATEPTMNTSDLLDLRFATEQCIADTDRINETTAKLRQRLAEACQAAIGKLCVFGIGYRSLVKNPKTGELDGDIGILRAIIPGDRYTMQLGKSYPYCRPLTFTEVDKLLAGNNNPT